MRLYRGAGTEFHDRRYPQVSVPRGDPEHDREVQASGPLPDLTRRIFRQGTRTPEGSGPARLSRVVSKAATACQVRKVQFWSLKRVPDPFLKPLVFGVSGLPLKTQIFFCYNKVNEI